MALNDPFDRLEMPRDLASEFFAVFSRCEFAMKETSYRRADLSGLAAPAWQKLAGDAAGWLTVDAGSELAQAIDCLTQPAPQVQTFSDGWQARPLAGANVVTQAVNAAVRVRNNLFHGGKHTPESAPGRDERLVRSALVVLIAVLEQAPPNLRETYNNG